MSSNRHAHDVSAITSGGQPLLSAFASRYASATVAVESFRAANTTDQATLTASVGIPYCQVNYA